MKKPNILNIFKTDSENVIKDSEIIEMNYYDYITDSIQIDSTSKINFSSDSQIKFAEIEDHVDISLFKGLLSKLKVGRCSYSGTITIFGINGDLVIGRFCSIATNLMLICGDGYHRPKRLNTFPFPFIEPFKNFDMEKNYIKI
tara:strand:+ start:137 stop:565 length:429 start_codon:yes stop_codon:yes gene_type:complete